MVDSHTNGCPEPEVLAAYVDRGLSLAERARVDAHLASCPQCIALVAGVVRTVADVSAQLPGAVVTAEATPLVTRRFLAGALAAAAAVFAVVSAPLLVRPWIERDSGLVSLVDSVGEQRSVLGRLTGGFPHAPLGVPSAGGQDGRAAGTDRVQLTAGRIRESFGERQTPSQLHAFGVEQLLSGRYDDAAHALLAASRQQPTNAKYLSDVAAVQLERARLGLRPDDLPRALAAADRARRLDPSLREAWFNRALAASALSLTAEAKSAWAEYLTRDNSSPWATEARARLADLAKPTPAQAWTAIEGRLQQSIDASTADEAVRTQTTEARNLIENTLLPNWANAVLAGGSGQAELDRVRVMAQAMSRIAGDAIYVDAVAAIDAASSNASALRTLATAHRDYAAALALFSDDRVAAATPAFASARAGFGASPFALATEVQQGAIAYASGRGNDAAAILNGTLAAARSKHYAYAEGRSTYFLGLLAMGQTRFDEAQAQYEATLDTFTRMGDVEQQAAAHSLLAAMHDYLGDGASAWQHRSAAFRDLTATRSAKLKALVLGSAVQSIRAESPETALAVQDAALAAAIDGHREATVVDLLAQKASVLASLNRHSEAEASAREARSRLAQIPDAPTRQRVEVAVLATESEVYRSTDPAAAVAAANNAIAIVQQRRDRLRLAQLNLHLAQANIVWGNRLEEARQALNRGLDAFNQERAARNELLPISALDESWQLFDAAVQLSLKAGDYPRAFALAEGSRARSASELKRFGSVDLERVKASLGNDEAIIALNQFETELAVWVIRNDSVNVITRPLSHQTAVQLVNQQRDEIWSGADNTVAGRVLYNEIVRSAAAHLSGVSRFVIIPDETYESVSFPALYNSTTGRFLVEDGTVRTSLTAGAVVAAKTARRGAIDQPLIFDSTDTGDTAAIAAAYPASQVRSGAEATRERFFSDANGRRIVHVTASASYNPSYPLFSRLQVRDEPGIPRSGVILGRDLVQRPLQGTSVVVIDDAGAAVSHRGEGSSGLARAFTAAGVSAVVGTLPGADDTATRDLMIGFHREMAKGVSAEQALSTVQRNAIQQNGRRLGAWSALVVYGSDR